MTFIPLPYRSAPLLVRLPQGPFDRAFCGYGGVTVFSTIEQLPPQMQQTDVNRPRRHDLDWLRVFAFLVLIFFHVGMFYVTWDWHVKSEHASPALEPLMDMVSPWRLSLLFFISGVALRFAADTGSIRWLLPSRIARLTIPLIVGMLVVVMPQAYLELRANGEIEPGIWSFYPKYLAMDGSFSIITPTWNHLWYLAYMIVYTIVVVATSPLLVAIEKRFGVKLGKMVTGHTIGLLLLPIVPFVIYRLTLDRLFPVTHTMVDDWATHAHAFTMLLIGWFIAKSPTFWNATRRAGRVAFACAILLLISLTVLRDNWQSVRTIAGAFEALSFMEALYAWSVIVALLSLAQSFLNVPSPALTYLSEAVFPLYILHQTVIIVTGYLLIGSGLPGTVEATIIVISTFAACFGLHEVIRRMSWLRPLFGLRRRKRKVRTNFPQRSLLVDHFK